MCLCNTSALSLAVATSCSRVVTLRCGAIPLVTSCRNVPQRPSENIGPLRHRELMGEHRHRRHRCWRCLWGLPWGSKDRAGSTILKLARIPGSKLFCWSPNQYTKLSRPLSALTVPWAPAPSYRPIGALSAPPHADKSFSYRRFRNHTLWNAYF